MRRGGEGRGEEGEGRGGKGRRGEGKGGGGEGEEEYNKLLKMTKTLFESVKLIFSKC